MYGPEDYETPWCCEVRYKWEGIFDSIRWKWRGVKTFFHKMSFKIRGKDWDKYVKERDEFNSAMSDVLQRQMIHEFNKARDDYLKSFMPKEDKDKKE